MNITRKCLSACYVGLNISPVKLISFTSTLPYKEDYTRKCISAVIRTISVNQLTLSKHVVSFEELETLTTNKLTLIIDVREPEELLKTGVIPGSINIPLGQLEDTLLKLSNEEFEERYGHKKPSYSSRLIFSCHLGKRSADAADIAQKLGFLNVQNYAGGWLEYEEKKKL